MIEEEANKRWCPFARIIQFDIDGMSTGNRLYTAANDQMEFDGPALCIGSACMAWRATDDECTNPTQDQNSTADPYYKYAPAGYCGLAGKP